MRHDIAAVCAECKGATQKIYDGYKCGVCAGIDVTVLKDESLGGVEREYREVKRKAGVGERLKIVAWNADTHVDKEAHADGEVAEVIGGVSSMFTRIAGGEPYGYSALGANEYLTLEPSDIIRVNGTRFRMVDRKAAVGERVIVTGGSCACYETGDLAKVLSSNGRVAFVDLTENADYYDDGKWYIDRSDYRVLESVEITPLSEPLSAKPAPDQAAEIIVALTTRVAALEKRIDALVSGVEPIPRRVAQERPSVTVAEVTANLAERAKEARQRKRDDIVKRVKGDVADLLAQNHPNACVTNGVWLSDADGSTITDRVDFVVDRDKRTVVALVIELGLNKVIGRGIAKCAPGDVFNSHTGRAIALRRALGLTVPAEYLNL